MCVYAIEYLYFVGARTELMRHELRKHLQSRLNSAHDQHSGAERLSRPEFARDEVEGGELAVPTHQET